MSRRRKRNKKNISKNVKQAYNTDKSHHITAEGAINDIFKMVGATDADCKPIKNDYSFERDFSPIDEGSDKELSLSEKGRRFVYNILHGDLDLHFDVTEEIIKDSIEIHLSKFMRKILPFNHMNNIKVEVEKNGEHSFAFSFNVNINGQIIGACGFCNKEGKLLATDRDMLNGVFDSIEEKADESYEKYKNLLGFQLPNDHPRAKYLGTNVKKYLRGLYFKHLNDKELATFQMSDEQVEDAVYKTIHSLVDKGFIDPNKEGAKEWLKSIIDELC